MSAPDSFGGIHPALAQQWQEAEYDAEPDSPPEFLTAEQLMTVWDTSHRSVHRRLETLKAAGRIEVGGRYKRDATGRRIMVQAYKLLPKAAES